MARFNSSLISNTITGTTSVGSPYNGAFSELTGTAPYTVTLASPVLFPGVNQTFYNATSGTVTLSTPAGNFVGTGGTAATTVPVYAGNVVSVTADGTNYIVISEDGSALTATSATVSGVLTVQSSGGVAIAPSTTGNIDNVNVGATTRGSGAFNTLAANNAVTFTAGTASTTTGTGTLVVTGGLGVSGTINATSVSASLTGTIQTAAQTNITSVGTLTGLAVSGSVGIGTSASASALIRAFAPDTLANVLHLSNTNSSGGTGTYRGLLIDGTHPNNATQYYGIQLQPSQATTAPMTGIDMSWSQVYSEGRGVNISLSKNTHSGGGAGYGIFASTISTGVNDYAHEAIGGMFKVSSGAGALDPYPHWPAKFWNASAHASNATNLLSFGTEASFTQRGFVYYDRTNTALGIAGTNALSFNTNSTVRMIINSTGGVEITNGAPTLTLNANTQATNVKKVRLASSNNNAGDFVVSAVNDDNSFKNYMFYVSNAGNVGLASPGYTISSPGTYGKLDIYQATDPATTPAALSVRIQGVGGGSGPQYGINVDASASYNGATALYGIRIVANQNVGSTTYGVHSTVNAGNSNTARFGVYGKTGFNSDAIHGLTNSTLPVGVYGEATNATGTTNISTSAAGYFLNSSTLGAVSLGVYINTTAGPTSIVPLKIDHASSELLRVDSTGKMGLGTNSPQVTFETGYTRVYNSGAAPSIGTGGPGKGLELHYVTSGRTQGEGGYAISYDRANSAYKALTLDASAINLSQSGATKVTIALGMLNVEPNLNIYSSNAGTASANGFCELFRVGSSSLCTSGIFSLGATRGGYVAGGLFTWSTTHNGSGRGVITQLSSGEYSNFSLSADVASGGDVIICADWGSSQSYSISVIKFVGGYIDYSNAGTLWASPSASYPARYTRSTIALGFKTQNGAFDGSLSKGSGSFRIEHPLPALKETHNLVHSFIEGPKADLIYRGKVALIAGRAEVNIDTAATMTEGTFELLCRDVQCFTTNETDWSPVRGSVTGNILTIECQSNTSTATISWMVIGERKDKHMYDTEWTDSSGRPIVEPLKNPVQTDFPPYPEHVNTNTTEENHGTI